MQADKVREMLKQCLHPYLEKDYYLGVHTGEYVCTICGKSGWGENWSKEDIIMKSENVKLKSC